MSLREWKVRSKPGYDLCRCETAVGLFLCLENQGHGGVALPIARE